MDTPEGLKTPRRTALTLPIILAAVVFVGLAVFAWAHLAAKGPAPQSGIDAQQAASGQTPATRDGYDAGDFTEPNSK